MGGATSPIVSNGEADVLVGFEPVETLRALVKCHKDTIIVTNTHPFPPFTVSVGQGSYPPVDEILDLIQAKTKKVFAIDGNALAAEAGNPLSLNMVMLGALIGSGSVPIGPEEMKQTLSTSTKKAFLESNLKAFDLGLESAKVAS